MDDNGINFETLGQGANQGGNRPQGGGQSTFDRYNSIVQGNQTEEIPLPARGAGIATPSVPSPGALARLREGRVDPENRSPAEFANMSWGEYLPIVGSNIVPSGVDAIKGIATAVMNPGDTATAIGKLGTGMGSKALDAAGNAVGYGPVFDPATKGEREAVADALIGNYKSRYGGGEEGEFWKNLAVDPMGYGADIATIASGGAGLAAKTGLINKAGNVSRYAGYAENLDPVQLAMNAVKNSPSVLAYPLMAANKLGTGLPFEVLQTARRAGLSGDKEAAAAFVTALKGNPNFNEDMKIRFEKAVEELEAEGKAKYLASLRSSSLNNAEVDLTLSSMTRDEIEKMIDLNARNSVLDYDLGYSADDLASARAAINAIDEVRTNPNAKGRTIEELDNVKRAIYRHSQKISDPVLKQRIAGLSGDLSFDMSMTDPAYGRAMGSYQAMIDALNQTTKDFGSSTLSDAQRAKKLATAFKKKDADEIFSRLEGVPSGKNLRYSLSGQAANPWLSDRARNTIASMGGLGAAGFYFGQHPGAALALGVGLANASPRVAAGTQYNLGRLERGIGKVVDPIKRYASPVATNIGSQLGEAMAPDYETNAQAYGGRVERNSGGRVGMQHERDADQLVMAAERAKKGISKGTESLLDMSDNHIAHALEVANRSI